MQTLVLRCMEGRRDKTRPLGHHHQASNSVVSPNVPAIQVTVKKGSLILKHVRQSVKLAAKEALMMSDGVVPKSTVQGEVLLCHRNTSMLSHSCTQF